MRLTRARYQNSQGLHEQEVFNINNIKKQQTDSINESIQNHILSSKEEGRVRWSRKVKLDKEAQQLGGTTTRIATDNFSMPTYRENKVSEPIYTKTRKSAVAMSEMMPDINNMKTGVDTVGEATVENFEAIRKAYFIKSVEDKSEKDMLDIPSELNERIEGYNKTITTLDNTLESNLRVFNRDMGNLKLNIADNMATVENELGMKIPSVAISPDDAIVFTSLSSNAKLTRAYKAKVEGQKAEGITKFIIKDREVHEGVMETLKNAKNSPDVFGIHLQHDAMVYDVVNMTDKAVTLKTNHILADSISLKIELPEGKHMVDLSNEVNNKLWRKETTNIGEMSNKLRYVKHNLDEPIFFGVADGKVRRTDRRYLMELLNTKFTPLEGALDAENHAVKINVHEIVKKTVSINFPWMLSDKHELPKLEGIGFQAVRESIEELTGVSLKQSMDLKKLSTTDFASNNRTLMIEATEESISEKVKGKVLREYMDDVIGDKSRSSGLIRVAKKYLESTNTPISVDNIQQVLTQMITPVSQDAELSKHFKYIADLANDTNEIETAMNFSSSNTSLERTAEIAAERQEFLDVNDDNVRVPRDVDVDMYREATTDGGLGDEDVEKLSRRESAKKKRKDSKVAYNKKMDAYNKMIEDPDYLPKAKLDLKMESYRQSQAKAYAESSASYGPAMKAIDEIQGLERKTKGFIDTQAKSKMKTMGENNKFIQEAFDTTQDSDDFVNDFKKSFKKTISNEAERIQGSTGITIRALKEMQKSEGIHIAQQYIAEQGGEGVSANFGRGLRKLIPAKELDKMLATSKVTNVADYESITMIADLMGAKITGTGMDANKNLVRFDVKNALPNFEGGASTKIQTDSGELMLIVDKSSQANKTIFTANIKPGEIDLQKKNVALAQKNIPILLKAKSSLKTTMDKRQYAILTNSHMNYDSVTTRRGGGYGAISPVKNLQNFKEFLNDGGKAITLDYETTGLPDNMAKEHFQAVQVAMQDVNVTKDANGKFVFGGEETIRTKYLAPNKDTIKKMNEIAMPDNTERIASNLSSKSDADVWMLKNYAKYNTDEINVNGTMMSKGELFTSQARTVENTVDGATTQMVQVAKKVSDGKHMVNVWSDTGMAPKQFAENLQESATEVTNHLRGVSGVDTKFGIDSKDVFKHETSNDGLCKSRERRQIYYRS